MKKNILLSLAFSSLLIFGFVQNAFAVPIYISSTNDGAGAVATSVAMTAFNVTRGNLIIAFTKYSSNSAIPTIGDSAGNTWFRGTGATTTLPSSMWSWYAIATSTVSDTITVSTTVSAAIVPQADQFSGTATVSPLDASSTTNNGNSGVTSCTTGPVTPSHNGELIWGGCIQQSSNGFGLTPGPGFTMAASTTRTGSQYMIQTTSTPVSSTITVGTSDGLIAAMMTFQTNPIIIPTADVTISGAVTITGGVTIR